MPIARGRLAFRQRTPSARRKQRSEGFTLLEILIVIAVLGLLIVMLSQATRFGLTAWSMQARGVEQQSDLLAVENALRQLIAHMKPGEPNQDDAAFIGNRAECRFVTDLPIAAGGLPTHEVAVALAVDRTHRLVLSWTPHPHAQWLGPPVVPERTVLLEHVDAIELGYQDPAVAGGVSWQHEWASRALPRLIRLHIQVPQGDGRRWPDIVMAAVEEPMP